MRLSGVRTLSQHDMEDRSRERSRDIGVKRSRNREGRTIVVASWLWIGGRWES